MTPRSQGVSSSGPPSLPEGGKMRDPGNEVVEVVQDAWLNIAR